MNLKPGPEVICCTGLRQNRGFLDVAEARDPSRPNSSKACADCLLRDADHADL